MTTLELRKVAHLIFMDVRPPEQCTLTPDEVRQCSDLRATARWDVAHYARLAAEARTKAAAEEMLKRLEQADILACGLDMLLESARREQRPSRPKRLWRWLTRWTRRKA